MTSTVTAVSLALLVLFIVGIHSTEIEPVMTKRKRKRLDKERYDINPALRGRK